MLNRDLKHLELYPSPLHPSLVFSPGISSGCPPRPAKQLAVISEKTQCISEQALWFRNFKRA